MSVETDLFGDEGWVDLDEIKFLIKINDRYNEEEPYSTHLRHLFTPALQFLGEFLFILFHQHLLL